MTKSPANIPKSRSRTAGPCSHVDRQYSEWAGCPICGVRELNFGQDKTVAPDLLQARSDGPAAKKDKKPKRRGNNPYGARGKLRCIHCQESRRKCEYTSLDATCLRCQKQSLICGKKLHLRDGRTMQSSSSPDSGSSDSNNSLVPFTITRNPQLPETDNVASVDQNYFSYFLQTMNTILPYCNLFPTVVGDIFRQSTLSSPVRHSLLSLSSMISDYRLKRPPDRFQYQYIKTLQLIQNSLLKNDGIDEGIAIAVYLMLCIDTVRADLDTARKHLKGLFLILQQLQQKPVLSLNGDYGPITKVSPLMMHIWRVSIKIDWTASLYLVEPPILPRIPAAEDLHRQWITKSAFATDADWALTAFSLDNLIHKACHFAAQVRHIRLQSHPTDIEVEKRVKSLVAILQSEIDAWDQRPLVQQAELDEAAAQLSDGPMGESFLDYEPLVIHNPFYCNLRNAWRALSIYTSLILDPRIGPDPPSRYSHAIEICRTLAALGPRDTSYCEFGKLWVILLSGVTFGGWRSPRETMWVAGRMEYITERFPVNDPRKGNVETFTSYAEICGIEGDFWEEMDKRRDRSRFTGCEVAGVEDDSE